MTKHSYYPYTSTYSSTRHNTNKNTTSIKFLTQTYNILQHAKHYLQKRPLHNKHSHRPAHIHCNRHKNKHAPYTYIYCLRHLATTGNNNILRAHPLHISRTEEILPRLTRRTIAQLRTNKSPFVELYLHRLDAKSHPSPLFPICNTHIHNTHHHFNCTLIHTTLSPLDLWTDPAGVTALLVDHNRKDRTPPTCKGHGSG